MSAPAAPAGGLEAAENQTLPARSQSRLDELLARAHAEQSQGRLEDAEATCRAVLSLEEGHAGAWHLRGIIAFRAGDSATALAHIERAATLAPQKADIRNSLGFALRALRRD